MIGNTPLADYIYIYIYMDFELKYWQPCNRSASVSWLLSMCGYTVSTLEGGYRSYWRWCRALVSEQTLHKDPPLPVVNAVCVWINSLRFLARDSRLQFSRFILTVNIWCVLLSIHIVPVHILSFLCCPRVNICLSSFYVVNAICLHVHTTVWQAPSSF